ncbi:hypothetical protein ACIOD1_12965 [Streptomyces sp. NPDC088097]|uniref:hypothetical protein n=1 Tax=Streptomyces sp. NPDC088097 TaxID=3365823 RepID=UPI003821D4C2
MAFETTYEAFLARVTAQRGPAEARAMCEPFARNLSGDIQALATDADPDDAAQFLRLADQMDPDRREVPDGTA